MGDGHPREGVVCRPLIELRTNNGERLICKHKGEKFEERATPQKVVDPETGKKKATRAWTGQFVTEVPAKAELSTLMQGRAKQVPYEYLLKLFQDKHEVKTDYDFLAVNPSSLGKFSVLPTDSKPNDIKPTPIVKSLPRFYIRGTR